MQHRLSKLARLPTVSTACVSLSRTMKRWATGRSGPVRGRRERAVMVGGEVYRSASAPQWKNCKSDLHRRCPRHLVSSDAESALRLTRPGPRLYASHQAPRTEKRGRAVTRHLMSSERDKWTVTNRHVVRHVDSGAPLSFGQAPSDVDDNGCGSKDQGVAVGERAALPPRRDSA